jgi:hypothetical protein
VPRGSRPVTLSIRGAEADKILVAAFGNHPNVATCGATAAVGRTSRRRSRTAT